MRCTITTGARLPPPGSTGHFTGIAESRILSLDVTNFVRDHPDQEITFLIAREVRYDGEDVDDDLAALKLASRERGKIPSPQLLMTLSDSVLPADHNHSGGVGARSVRE